MKFFVGYMPLLLAVLEVNVDAFAPTKLAGMQTSSSTTARAFSPMDPSSLQELPHHARSLSDFISTFSVADADAIATQATQIAATVDPTGAVGEVAAEVAKSNNGWFGFLTGPTMAFLEMIHNGLVSVGVNSNSWGISIIALTMAIKLLTFPLTKAQLESTQKMQVCVICKYMIN